MHDSRINRSKDGMLSCKNAPDWPIPKRNIKLFILFYFFYKSYLYIQAQGMNLFMPFSFEMQLCCCYKYSSFLDINHFLKGD